MATEPRSEEERARAAGEELLAQRRGDTELRTRQSVRRLILVVATTLLVALLLWWLQG
jgi:hypothetical protein